MSYGKVAGIYAFCESLVFGCSLRVIREAYLEDLADHCSVDGGKLLIVGGGDGRFLVSLLRKGVAARIDYVEISQRMIEVAKARVVKAGFEVESVNWIQQDFESWYGTGYDAVVAHFYLDGYEYCASGLVMDKMVDALRERGLLIVADFDPDIVWWARCWVWVMQVFFWFTSGVKPVDFKREDAGFRRRGLQMESSRELSKGFIYTTKWRKS